MNNTVLESTGAQFDFYSQFPIALLAIVNDFEHPSRTICLANKLFKHAESTTDSPYIPLHSQDSPQSSRAQMAYPGIICCAC